MAWKNPRIGVLLFQRVPYDMLYLWVLKSMYEGIATFKLNEDFFSTIYLFYNMILEPIMKLCKICVPFWVPPENL